MKNIEKWLMLWSTDAPSDRDNVAPQPTEEVAALLQRLAVGAPIRNASLNEAVAVETEEAC